jgi:hypothetical protein
MLARNLLTSKSLFGDGIVETKKFTFFLLCCQSLSIPTPDAPALKKICPAATLRSGQVVFVLG